MALVTTLKLLLAWALASPPAVLLPIRVAAVGTAVAKAALSARKAPVPRSREDAVLVLLYEVDGLQAKGRILACRLKDEWKNGAPCPASLVAGEELRVFTGRGGEVATWSAAPITAAPTVSDPTTIGGTLSTALPAPPADGDALSVPFAMLGSARHVVVPPVTEGVGPERLTRLMEASRTEMRMHREMSEGLVTAQYAVADFAPYLREAVLVAGSTYAEGPLDKAPLPTASLIGIHAADEGAESGILPIRLTSQVISARSDSRRFERYRLAAVLDFDGDGWRELLVRGQSARGDRFCLYELADGRFARPLGTWVGAEQPASAPMLERPGVR